MMHSHTACTHTTTTALGRVVVVCACARTRVRVCVSFARPPFNREDSKSRRCLICDDVPLIRATVHNLIAKALPPNWVIFEAEHGEEAIKLHQENKFDLVLVDYHMQSSGGVLTGAETAARLLSINSQTVVVGVLGISSVDDDKKRRLLGAGCFDVWGKPPPDPQRMSEVLFGVTAQPHLFDAKDLTRKVALVCDDVDHARATHVRALEDLFPHWDVVSVKHGEDALQHGMTADLVLMDFHLSSSGGELNGAETTQRLRELNPAIVVIGVTANADDGESEREQLLDAGCADVLGKPLNRPELARTVFGDDGSALDNGEVPIIADEIMDLPRAVCNQGGDASDLHILLPELVQEIMAMLQQMCETIMEAGRVELQLTTLVQDQLKRSAHALKGLALNFACSQLAKCAHRLEQAAAQYEPIPQLQSLLDDTQSAARAVARQVEDGTGPPLEDGAGPPADGARAASPLSSAAGYSPAPTPDPDRRDSSFESVIERSTIDTDCSELSGETSPQRIVPASPSASSWSAKMDDRRDAEIVPEETPACTADVLLVEDSSLVRTVVLKLLAMKKLTCNYAVNGSEAVKRLEQGERYRLVLMDKVMPVMDGLEATRKLRDIDTSRRMAIVGLTADDDAATRRDFIHAGANDMVTKPLDLDVIERLKVMYMDEF